MGGLGIRTRIGVVVVLRDGDFSYRIEADLLIDHRCEPIDRYLREDK